MKTCKRDCLTKLKSKCKTARNYIKTKLAGQVGREKPIKTGVKFCKHANVCEQNIRIKMKAVKRGKFMERKSKKSVRKDRGKKQERLAKTNLFKHLNQKD